MIEKEYGKYIVECDGCGFVMNSSFDTYAEAAEAIQLDGWSKDTYEGDKVHYCPDCADMIERDERKVGVST